MKHYKCLREDETHYGMKYKKGFNKDVIPFNSNENDSCCKGGIYFSDSKNIIKFLDYGPYIREVTLPKNEIIIKDNDNDKYRTNQVILGRKFRWNNNQKFWNDIFKHSKIPENIGDKFVHYCKYGQKDKILETIEKNNVHFRNI